MKRALLIGCNYQNTPAQLYGCINDSVNMGAMLMDAFGYAPSEIRVLRDDMRDQPALLPTKANILASLTDIIAASAKCSEIVIQYSGHGSRVLDVNGDEGDGQDEVIVPLDYATAGIITDDEIFNIIKNTRCKTLLFFDSCNSGSICDLEYSFENLITAVQRKRLNPLRRLVGKEIYCISGCKDTQYSMDTWSSYQAQAVGAFTNALLTAMRNNNHYVTMLKLYVDTCKLLRATGYEQVPILSSTVTVPSYSFAKRYAGTTNVSATIGKFNAIMPVKTVNFAQAGKMKMNMFQRF